MICMTEKSWNFVYMLWFNMVQNEVIELFEYSVLIIIIIIARCKWNILYIYEHLVFVMKFVQIIELYIPVFKYLADLQ